ncbi:MAG: hypothetical protein M0R77_20035 [Gammaproteobacteria bacterium]|nr:hypothetical protein [Gammaproteobacteria bacterium]
MDALQRYLDQEEWQTQAITRADQAEARYASHEAVDAWLASWVPAPREFVFSDLPYVIP